MPIIQESFHQHLVFHLLITASLITTVGLFIKAKSENNSRTVRRYVLGSGIVGLLIGLTVFPIGALQMMDALEMASRNNGKLAIVKGGFFLPFIPLLYVIFSFLISLGGWFWLRKTKSIE